MEVMEEPLVSRGVASTLRLLINRGVIKKEYGENEPLKNKSNEKKEPFVHLEYKDEHGRILTPKEAFKLLSHKFHGKTPGKMKTEKLLKKIQTEKAILSKNSSSSSCQMEAKSRAALGTAHIIVSNSTILAPTLKNASTVNSTKRERDYFQNDKIISRKKKVFGMK